MHIFLNITLLLLGSGLMAWRLNKPLGPWRDHVGMILLLYGFGHFLAYLLGFTALLKTSPLMAAVWGGLWVLLMIMGFTLAYPLLERHLFQSHSDLEAQGKRVFEGFHGMRVLLGLAGIGLAITVLLARLGVL